MNTSLRKILITGAGGQLGHALQQHVAGKQYALLPLSHQALDVTDHRAVQKAIVTHQPSVVINAAAYTAVDKAESEPERCAAINRDGAKQLAMACHEFDIPLIHVSTDYVFDGMQSAPYREDDATHPLNVYGQSKLEGEEAVKSLCKHHVILRVSGIFSLHGHNFLNTMLRLSQERTELNMVGDQITCPTYAGDIAGAIYAIARQVSHHGTYHYCSAPVTTWYDFAAEIIRLVAQKKPITLKTLHRITADQYQTPAKRPMYSALDCAKLKNDYGIEQPDWRESLKLIFKGI